VWGGAAGGAGGEPGNRIPAVKDVVADMLTALESVGLGGIWAVFTEKPDAVVMLEEGDYKVTLVGKFVKIRITMDTEFNVKYVEVNI